MSRTLVVAFFVSLITALFTSILLNTYIVQQRIGTVDIVKITSLFIQQEATKNHTHAEKEQAIKAFSASLENSLARLAERHSLILMPKEAVIKGSVDYTDKLTEMMAMEQNP